MDCGGVEHILVVIFVSSREDSLMFARSSVFPKRAGFIILKLNNKAINYYHGLLNFML